MPSIAEAFGLMAIEALAAGVKPIVADGTSLPYLVNAPHVGVSCKPHIDDLYGAIVTEIHNLSSNVTVRESRKQFASKHYGLKEFCKNMANIYHEEYLLYHDKNRLYL